MLDSVSLPTPAAACPPTVNAARTGGADRHGDAPTAVSAFTAVVDALTGESGATRTDRRDDDDAGPDADRHAQDDADATQAAIVAAEAAVPKAIAAAVAIARRGSDVTASDPRARGRAEEPADAGARARAALAAAVVAAGLAGAAEIDVDNATGGAPDPAGLPGRQTAALAAALAAELARAEESGAESNTSADAQRGDSDPNGSKAPLSRSAIALAALRLSGESELPASRASQIMDAAVAASAGTRATAHADALAANLLALPSLPTGATLVHATLAHTLSTAELPGGASLGGVPTTDTGLQIVQAMRLQWANGVGEAHINLEPNYFGDVSISLRVDQGQVTARVQAEAPVVREWLQTNQNWLRQSLADQGLTLGRLEVTEPAAESSHEDRREPSREGRDETPSKRSRRLLPGEVFEVIA